MEEFKAKYEVERMVASGAFNSIYLARDKTNDSLRAVKYVRKTFLGNKNSSPQLHEQRYFKNELKVLKTIKNNPHPNICKVKELYEDEEGLLVVQEYLGKGTLFDWISRIEHKKNREEKVRKMFWKILKAVDHLHNNLWIVHRDLKLENIMLDWNKEPKIVDFNLSTCWSKEKLISTEFCGSLLYCPPELLLKKSYRGPPQDIWSLGVLLYVMLFSTFPFTIEEEEIKREEEGKIDADENFLLLFEEEEEEEKKREEKRKEEIQKREQERQETLIEIKKKIIERKFTIPSSSSPSPLVVNLLCSLLQNHPKKRPTIIELKAHPWFERERREEERGKRKNTLWK